MVKKDQLFAIAFMKRRYILKVLLKMVAMATSHTLKDFNLKHCSGANPGFFLGGGAPLRNDVTD